MPPVESSNTFGGINGSSVMTFTRSPAATPPPAEKEGTSATPETTHLSYASVAAFDAIIDSLADAVDKDLRHSRDALVAGSARSELRKRTAQLASLRCLKEYKDFQVTSNEKGWYPVNLIVQRMTHVAIKLKAEGFDDACTQALVQHRESCC